MTARRSLTGITTTGSPHLGNYVGAIRPAVAASRDPAVESFYFLADLHALVKCGEPERVQRSTLEIAATWLACGLDPEANYFYRQSDIKEIPELTWFLTCVVGKGLLNRAHAYKAAVDQNRAKEADEDDGINAGLFMYPVLMAADIMVFNATEVPVGRDQVQHIEMARDMAQRFNHLFGQGEQLLVPPEARIDEQVATLPGLDGRKMSKSYNNTIPLWLPKDELRRALLGIVTNSLAPGEPKNPDDSNIFSIYQAFASADETAAMRRAYADGIAWGEAKQRLFERIDAEVGPLRAEYERLMRDPGYIEATLVAGAKKARVRSGELLETLRRAVGLRDLSTGASAAVAGRTTSAEADVAEFSNPFRDPLGFGFRIWFAGKKKELVAAGLADGRAAGALIKTLKATPADGLDLRVVTVADGSHALTLFIDGAAVAAGAGVADRTQADADLAQCRGALAALYQATHDGAN